MPYAGVYPAWQRGRRREDGRKDGNVDETATSCSCLVCVIRFTQSGLAGDAATPQPTPRHCRPNNRLSRLRNHRHAWKGGKKEGREPQAALAARSCGGRPVLRCTVFTQPSLRFRAFLRSLLPSFRPSIRCAHYGARRFASTSCPPHTQLWPNHAARILRLSVWAGGILNGSLSTFNAEKEHRSGGRKGREGKREAR